jgi:hypothetical protein
MYMYRYSDMYAGTGCMEKYHSASLERDANDSVTSLHPLSDSEAGPTCAVQLDAEADVER